MSRYKDRLVVAILSGRQPIRNAEGNTGPGIVTYNCGLLQMVVMIWFSKILVHNNSPP